MSQPVKLSDSLVLDARLTSKVAERSIAGQIEYWAQLGRALEPLLRGAQALALRQAGSVRPLSDCLASASSESGRRRVAEFIHQQPFPHYEPAGEPADELGQKPAAVPGLLVRIDADGTRTLGRFIQRRFVPVS